MSDAQDMPAHNGVIEEIRSRTLAYVEAQRLKDAAYGRYRYSHDSRRETLYSSCYAAMTRGLYNDLDSVTSQQRNEWIDYLQSHQDDDGLFRDPAIFGEGWYKGDPLTCGRSHLTCHVIVALRCLGAVARRPIQWLDPFCQAGAIERWLTERNWGARVDSTGNEVMNVGALLQYVRDFQQHPKAGRTLQALLAWMEKHHLNPETGLWGMLDVSDPVQRSRAVQGAYHFWPLCTYDGRPIPFPERAADSVLATQNPQGGFGWGVHNRDKPFNSSACEDIDSIEPLFRFLQMSDYRRADIRAALERTLPWVLSNQNTDGGFVFTRDSAFEYGHPVMRSGPDESAMFPTWFRTLTLAYLGRALPESLLGAYPWHFRRCPGYQF